MQIHEAARNSAGKFINVWRKVKKKMRLFYSQNYDNGTINFLPGQQASTFEQIRNRRGDFAEQAALTKETLTYNVLKAGTNVFYANGSARNAVNTPITKALVRRVTRALKVQNARKISSVLASEVKFNTQPIEAGFITLVHPNCENDVREIDGFIPVKNYAQGKAMEGEIGSVEDMRFISSTVFTAFADAGGAAGTMLSTTGTSADVYPMITLAKEAFSIIPLRGSNVAQMYVVYPKATNVDPLAQRGTIGYKFYHASIITNEFNLVRMEVAATA